LSSTSRRRGTHGSCGFHRNHSCRRIGALYFGPLCCCFAGAHRLGHRRRQRVHVDDRLLPRLRLRSRLRAGAFGARSGDLPRRLRASAAAAVPNKKTVAVTAYIAAIPLLLSIAVATAPGLAPMSGLLPIEEEKFVQPVAVRINTNAPIVVEFKRRTSTTTAPTGSTQRSGGGTPCRRREAT
jgi:hypothetical protein